MKTELLISLLTCFLNYGCGSEETRDFITGEHKEPEKTFVNSEFNEFYDLFKKLYDIDPYKISIDFEDLDKTTAGVCYLYTNGAAEIKIDRTYWKKMTHNGKESLIFHELGHCAGNLDHDDEMIEVKPDYKIHRSIMNSSVIGMFKYYETYHNYYYGELGVKLKTK